MSHLVKIWNSAYTEGYCVVTAPKNVTKFYKYDYGSSLQAGWPASAECWMDMEFPKDIQLSDAIHCLSARIISPRAYALFHEFCANTDIEFLKISIVNHKGRLAADDYWIVNPLRIVDCIDTAQSQVTWNPIDHELISDCKDLVLKPEALADAPLVFRPKHKPSAIFMKTAFTEKLESCGLSNFRLMEATRYYL
ncbi:MAG: hypothetical protein HYV16_03330 [Gammaproteobacteria bacterium]|nr:hypothetical protein [Gammaproteobacteria bacterium]